MAASATVLSEYRVRGHAISGSHPALNAGLSYDDASGIYANASVIGVLAPHSGPGLLGAQGNVGYSTRLGSGPALDLGVVHTEYTSRYSGGRAARYTEAYLGVIAGDLSSHVYFSPNYLRDGVKTIYVDIEGVVRPAPNLRLIGHVGVLTQLSGPRDRRIEASQYDVQIAAARRIGPVDVQLAWTTGGPDRDYYAQRPHGKSRFVLGLTYIF